MNTTTLLAILQQSEYDFHILKRWEKAHRHEDIRLEPEKWTAKLRVVRAACRALPMVPMLTRIQLGLWLLAPFEYVVRQLIYSQAQQKLASFRKNGLKVVAVAGSYGKTSTKNILVHTLSEQKKVLATPLSINTMLGISQIVKKDLLASHDVFIVELGEYHPEDIPQLTKFLQPDFGILTPIGRQHLEIIGGMENIIQSLKTFVDFFPKDRLIIHELNQAVFNMDASWYGKEKQSTLQVRNAKVTRAGTEFEVFVENTDQPYSAFIPLFGEHQAINTLTAIWMGEKLGIEPKHIIKRLRTLPYITRRHEPTFAEHNVLILDNSYNTNPDSVQESLKLVNALEPSKRFIVTVGFTELGDESEKIHREFGKQLANQIDYVGLIKAPWSDTIVDGFVSAGGNKDHIFIGQSQEEAFAKIQKFVVPNSVVLFEGGYREVYI